MAVKSQEELRETKCVPCEGGTEKLSAEEARSQLEALHGWELDGDSLRIRKSWTLKNFMAAIDFFNKVAQIAEIDDHHPDLHLEGYRNVRVELTTHAIGGLSENDFIIAAKIDQVPVELKS